MSGSWLLLAVSLMRTLIFDRSAGVGAAPSARKRTLRYVGMRVVEEIAMRRQRRENSTVVGTGTGTGTSSDDTTVVTMAPP